MPYQPMAANNYKQVDNVNDCPDLQQLCINYIIYNTLYISKE